MKEEKSEYDLKAESFLKKTGTTFKAEFLKHDYYFQDDKEKRDIYEITLKRGEREYKFKFGQSLNDSGLLLYLSNHKRTGHKGFEIPQEIRQALTQFKTRNEELKARMSLTRWFNENHFTLSGLTWEFKKPSAYDVLACLQKHEVGSFKDFCEDFGYDDDSRKAEKTYKAVCEEYDNVKMLYNEKEIEILQEIS